METDGAAGKARPSRGPNPTRGSDGVVLLQRPRGSISSSDWVSFLGQRPDLALPSGSSLRSAGAIGNDGHKLWPNKEQFELAAELPSWGAAKLRCLGLKSWELPKEPGKAPERWFSFCLCHTGFFHAPDPARRPSPPMQQPVFRQGLGAGLVGGAHSRGQQEGFLET